MLLITRCGGLLRFFVLLESFIYVQYLTGETVKLVCRDRKTMKEIYIDVAESNKYGKYKFVGP